jgi:hypothetical protein
MGSRLSAPALGWDFGRSVAMNTVSVVSAAINVLCCKTAKAGIAHPRLQDRQQVRLRVEQLLTQHHVVESAFCFDGRF